MDFFGCCTGGCGGGRDCLAPRLRSRSAPFYGGPARFYPRKSPKNFGFRGQLRSLLHFPVAVLTTGGVAPIFGTLTRVQGNFVPWREHPLELATFPSTK